MADTIPGAKTWVNYSFRTSVNKSASPEEESFQQEDSTTVDDWSHEAPPRQRTLSDSHFVVRRSWDPAELSVARLPLSATRMRVVSPSSGSLNVSNDSAQNLSGASLRRRKRLRRSLGVSLSPTKARRATAGGLDSQGAAAGSADGLDQLLREAQAALRSQVDGLRATIGAQRHMAGSGSMLSAAPVLSQPHNHSLQHSEHAAAAPHAGLPTDSSSDGDMAYAGAVLGQQLRHMTSPFFSQSASGLLDTEGGSSGEERGVAGTPVLQASDSPELAQKGGTGRGVPKEQPVDEDPEAEDAARDDPPAMADPAPEEGLAPTAALSAAEEEPHELGAAADLPPLVASGSLAPSVASVSSSAASKSSTPSVRKSLKKLFRASKKGKKGQEGRPSIDGSVASSIAIEPDQATTPAGIADAPTTSQDKSAGKTKFKLFSSRKSKR